MWANCPNIEPEPETPPPEPPPLAENIDGLELENELHLTHGAQCQSGCEEHEPQ